ncbi:MAG: hypothetical protein AB7U20_00830 [Planctomycetaceae bacterium]
MPNDDHDRITTDELVVFADLQPGQAQTDEQKIDTLLDLLASGFEGDSDLDLVRDVALYILLHFPRLPDRTIDIMLGILAAEDDSDLTLARKVEACDVLAHLGQQAKPALAILNDLLPLVESERDSKRWLALRRQGHVEDHWGLTACGGSR